jgi:hypothetical protein
MNFTERLLFGGAISAEIPSTWIDISDIRQVPDHQECYQETLPPDVPNEPGLVVVEILERATDVDDPNAANHYFNDLAESNGIISRTDVHFQMIPPSIFASPTMGSLNGRVALRTAGESVVRTYAGVGYQKISIGRDFDAQGNSRQAIQEVKWVRVDLIVFRLATQETDLLVTLSKPVGAPNVEPLFGLPVTLSPEMNRIISTLEIRDWGLFG